MGQSSGRKRKQTRSRRMHRTQPPERIEQARESPQNCAGKKLQKNHLWGETSARRLTRATAPHHVRRKTSRTRATTVDRDMPLASAFCFTSSAAPWAFSAAGAAR